MGQSSYRIRTNPGESKNIIVELSSNYDLFEILSLKFSQKDVYTRTCSDYGVVIGRVSSNNGMGVMNAKVSIFIPLDDEDLNDPVISTLYPYKSVADKNEDGYRYNLLPHLPSFSAHVPTGTFPDKTDVLYRDEVLEIYEKYYKYTVKTNSAGDYMLWGVPVGAQTIHIDVDLSDMGCFSVRPFDLIRQGKPVSSFANEYSYKSSIDIDSLPQIIKFDKSVEVVPFFGNDDLCQIGITRIDFDFSELGYSLQPTSLFIGSMITDAGPLAVSKNGKPHKRQGSKCKLETYEGDIQAIRFSGKKFLDPDGNYYPILESVNLERIDRDGTWMCALPMNLDYVTTDEYGDEIYTNDPNKGIPTAGTYRFRVSADYENDKMEVGDYLVPNIREFGNRSDGKLDESNKDTRLSYVFSTNFNDYFRIKDSGGGFHQNDQIRDLILGKNNNGVPEDYFFKFTYNKVYSVSSFHGTHFDGGARDAFVGIKEIVPNQDQDCDSSANKFPVNFGFKNRVNFQLILASVLLFFKFIIKNIQIRINEIVGSILYSVGRALDVWPVHRAGQKLQHAAYKWQEAGQLELPLTIYPICEECGQDAVISTATNIDPSELGQCMIASGYTNMVALKSAGVAPSFSFLQFNQSDYFNISIDPSICPNAQAITFNSLPSLHTIFSVSNIDEGLKNRYAIAIFTLTGDTQQSADSLITLGGFQFTTTSSSSCVVQFESIDTMYEFMSLADPSIAAGNQILTNIRYKYIIYDLDGTDNPQLIIPQYTIQEGCGKYDLFYDKTNLHPSKFIWAVNDRDYGSPELTIDDQNSYYSGNTFYTNGNGIYPDGVMRYYSYSDIPRQVIISGLDSTLTYDIEILGSRNVVNSESTIYKIGVQSITLNTSKNLTNVALFQNISPIFDKITIFIDKTATSSFNIINALKITRHGAGSGSGNIFVNVNGGIDIFTGTTGSEWNDFIINFGEQDNITQYNLSYTDSVDSNVNINLSYSLDIATNDVISPFQKIYFTPLRTSIPQPPPPFSQNDYVIIASVAATSNALALPSIINWSRIGRQTYKRKTKTGFTEIRNGMIIIVPVIRGKSDNIKVLKEWYNRNTISTSFCGGIVNHSFIDNWLTGILYAFKFKFRKGQSSFIDGIINGRKFKYPKELTYYDSAIDRYYYRSTPFNTTQQNFIGQRAIFAGKSYKEILRPTTVADLGPRDEFIAEICADARIDPNCSVVRDITHSSYQNIESIIEYAINYRLDITGSKFKVNDFFNRKMGGVLMFDSDIVQLESLNCEAGIDEFDLESPKYFMYTTDLMDPTDPLVDGYFRDSVPPHGYGPVPIDFKMKDNGRILRLCLNHPQFLGETSQTVPYFLWDKKAEGFGISTSSDAQEFKKDFIATAKLQRIYSTNLNFDYIIPNGTDINGFAPLYGKHLLVITGGTVNNPTSGLSYSGNNSNWISTGLYTNSTNYIVNDGTEQYINYPMTKNHDFIDFNLNGPDSLERFDFIALNASDRFLYNNSPEGTIFMQVITGTIDDPVNGAMYVMVNRQWKGPIAYNRNEDDVFITPTVVNYSGNLQVLSTPFLFYFGLRPGKTAFDRFIKSFGFKGAFKKNG